MSSEPIKGPSTVATEKLVEVWQGFTYASDLLDGLTPEQAVTKLETWPYSVAEQVAHMVFWQRHALNEIEKGVDETVPIASDNWPAVTLKDWPRLKDEVLANLDKNKEIARDAEMLKQPLLTSGTITVGAFMLQQVTHDCYHLGQVALLRRLMGAWSPPNGGNTW
jgi:uncharacterized damage-inducible protein DinB